MTIKASTLILLTFFVAVSFAQEIQLPNKEVSHTFYATGNLGTQASNQDNLVLKELYKVMERDGVNF